jgi:hypothetical protein
MMDGVENKIIELNENTEKGFGRVKIWRWSPPWFPHEL